MPTTKPASQVEKSGVLKFRVDTAKNTRQQAVARHRKPHARLAQLEDQQRGDHAHQSADQDDQAHIAKVQLLHGIDDGGGVVEQRLPGHESREHDHYGDVQHRADHQRGDNAARQVALRILALLGRGGNGVEADVGEEDDRAAGEDSRPAIGSERDASWRGE